MSQSASIPSLSCIAARAGAFVISPAHALTLRPKVPSELHIKCGKAWVTNGDGADYILQAGQSLRAAPGSSVVIEPWPGQSGDIESVYLDWDPLPLRIPVAAPAATVPAQRKSEPARIAVGQAWGDFRAAFVAAFLAGARLALALLGTAVPTTRRAPAGLRGV